MGAYDDAGANIVETAFAVVSWLKCAIDELIFRFWDNLAKTAWQERDANLAAG
jgi:hypothetical protein